MQYPIIDTIVEAYQRNGWTGLDISTGKNLIEQNDVFVDNTLLVRVPFYLEPGTYTLSCLLTVEPPTPGVRIAFRREDGTGIMAVTLPYSSNRTSVTFTLTEACYIIFFYYSSLTSGTGYQEYRDLQIESGTQATPYEPYAPPTTDIKNRFKLPMIHYFPHPVIDALQRAAAGTQTADDTEILRHYLTPLGIGGI